MKNERKIGVNMEKTEISETIIFEWKRFDESFYIGFDRVTWKKCDVIWFDDFSCTCWWIRSRFEKDTHAFLPNFVHSSWMFCAVSRNGFPLRLWFYTFRFSLRMIWRNNNIVKKHVRWTFDNILCMRNRARDLPSVGIRKISIPVHLYTYTSFQSV